MRGSRPGHRAVFGIDSEPRHRNPPQPRHVRTHPPSSYSARQRVHLLFLQSSSSPPLPILAMSSALRAAVQQVCQQPHTPPTTPLTPLPSPQSRRSAFARSARYASTSAKAPTLKERLAELIPAEIENVCAPFFVSPRSPTAHPSISLAIGESHPCCTRQKVLRSRSR